MSTKFVNTLHIVNIVFQSFYSLLFPVAIAGLISYLLTSNGIADSWVWAVALTVGFLIGLVSMIKFILSATANLDRIEKERAAERERRRVEAINRENLIAELKINEREDKTLE